MAYVSPKFYASCRVCNELHDALSFRAIEALDVFDLGVWRDLLVDAANLEILVGVGIVAPAVEIVAPWSQVDLALGHTPTIGAQKPTPHQFGLGVGLPHEARGRVEHARDGDRSGVGHRGFE